MGHDGRPALSDTPLPAEVEPPGGAVADRAESREQSQRGAPAAVPRELLAE